MSDRPIVVLKFGGRLVENPARINRAADYILGVRNSGAAPVVVVSAPGRATNHFLRMARRITAEPDRRELDMLLTVGERIAMSLLAMAVNRREPGRAVSFTGSQVGIITDTQHTDARILEVKGDRLRQALSEGRIPIVAGFQGVSRTREITTLGRGGSDATAVALAQSLGAARCELVKESGGVFTADPELIPEASLHQRMDWRTLAELTAAGAKVVQPAAAALASEHGIPLVVGDIDRRSGTTIGGASGAEPSGRIAGVVLEKGCRRIDIASPLPEAAVRHSFWDGRRGWAIVSGQPSGAGEAVDLVSVAGWHGQLASSVKAFLNEFIRQASPGTEVVTSVGRAAFIVEAGSGEELSRRLHDGGLQRDLIRIGEERPAGAAPMALG